jgi:hypothetical protein
VTDLRTHFGVQRASGAMASPRDLRAEAEHYRKLASTLWDRKARSVLDTMAAEFESLAREIEAEQGHQTRERVARLPECV